MLIQTPDMSALWSLKRLEGLRRDETSDNQQSAGRDRSSRKLGIHQASKLFQCSRFKEALHRQPWQKAPQRLQQLGMSDHHAGAQPIGRGLRVNNQSGVAEQRRG